MRRKYYALVAGLPDLAIDGQKLPYTVLSFGEEVYPQLSKADRMLFDLFFLKYDNKNLLLYLKNKEVSLDEKGHYTKEDFAELITLCREVDQPKQSLFPPYFITFLRHYNQEDSNANPVLESDYLSGLYYDYALECENRFVRNWFEMNLLLYNLLAATTARKYKYPVADYVVGNSETAKIIRTSNARDFGMGEVIENFEKIAAISEEADLLEKEKKIDLLKWQWIDDNITFHYFTVEKLYAHLLMLDMLERWAALDKETGQETFRAMVGTMKGSCIQPAKIITP